MDTTPISVTAHLFGKVQGVGFRDWTRRQADDLGLAGWVANEPDGSLRAVFAGPEPAVNAMLESLHHGPAGAEVTSLVTEPTETAFAESGFRILG